MGKRILLVEGKDDLHVMLNLFQVRSVPQVFTVECPEPESGRDEGGGLEALLESVPYQLTSSDLERLAIVIDANDRGPGPRWEAIRDRLHSKGFHGTPKSLSNEGTTFDLALQPNSPRTIRFGLWIMPDNQSPGMLEDFVAGMIQDEDAMLRRVDGFLESIPPDERRYADAHRPKARVHCWLAVSERPGRPMGQAIRADSYLDANHPAVQPFLDWITQALVD